MKIKLEARIEPQWSAAVALNSFLYGIWAASIFFPNHSSPQGYGIFVAVVFVPIFFLIALVITLYSLLWALIIFKNDVARLSLVLTALGVFLIGYGLPSLLITGTAILFSIFGYYGSKKARKDAADLQAFMAEDKNNGN